MISRTLPQTLWQALLLLLIVGSGLGGSVAATAAEERSLVYLVSDRRIPFWDILARGIENEAAALGYRLAVYSAENSAKREMENSVKAIRQGVDGIIVSPTNSSACVTILKLAKEAGIPVVIADIGTDGGEYVSYISSDNRGGAYQLGQILAAKMQRLGWQEGRVGIIAIPQKRANGQARTAGFMQALAEAGIKGGGLRQQVTFSYQETYDYTRELIQQTPDLRAIWLQGSDRYQGALDAIAASGKEGEILLITFDAEPEFLDLIPTGRLVGAGMQQPFLMGERAVQILNQYRQGERIESEIKLPVLAISTENIAEKLPLIKRNVLGIVADN
ncbi:sugar ABC transporter substrate-binding protein [Ectothiorhodospiraceae bacterium BW-2]|nr:sugar ABC transporter substrate-binding protein [Ectothiorhodospiraceae bacterium BW-2]